MSDLRAVIGQGLRFGIAGALVALVHLGSTLLLHHAAGLPFQAALALGFLVALATHFTLQRRFVWVHAGGFELLRSAQLRRYLVVALSQYLCTAALTRVLPGLLNLPTTAVYVMVTGVLTVAAFLVFRTRVFHVRRA